MTHMGFEPFKVRCRTGELADWKYTGLRPEMYNFIVLIFVSFVYAFAKFTCNASTWNFAQKESSNYILVNRREMLKSFIILFIIWQTTK